VPGSLLSILEGEVKPALGCTGPTSVSFTVSVAKDAVGGAPDKVEVLMDKDTYKNSIAVGIPGTSLRGLEIAAALGAVCGDSKAGLEVLKGASEKDELKAKELLKNTLVDIKWDLESVGLYIEARVDTDLGHARAVVAKTHTNTVLIEVNGKKVFEKEMPSGRIDYSSDEIRRYGLRDFFEFASQEPLENLLFLKKAIQMNLALADAGMADNVGAGFGLGYSRVFDGSMVNRAKALTAAASDARMAGLGLPAMSCATSGNVGITASLPLKVVAGTLNATEEDLIRSLALSFLLTIYMKSHIGRLSALCACAVAASVGITAGTVRLLGGGLEEAQMAINSVIGSIGGVICDGAKPGCALKLSNAAGIAIESAQLAMKGISIPSCDGIVCDSADKTMEMIGRIAREGMEQTDRTMCELIIEREKRREGHED